ncbi:MAG: hypothetical protein EPO16_02565 [Dehalococcoidia bacterium]|nr:MAG: hypothetical protein EPO16_02565 [Dehalococcoidia bacterium]
MAGATIVALLLIVFGAIRLLPLAGGSETPDGVPLAVFAEFGDLADKIYSAPADDPTKRTLLATVEHAAGWGINPATATRDGRAVFLLAPSNGGGREAPAEVWTINLRTGQRTRIAGDADLLIQPILNRDGSILYRRSNGLRQEIVRANVGDASRITVYGEDTTFGVFPVGEDAEGHLVVARLSTAGTDLLRVKEGAAQLIVHASDHVARGWQIAPDGKSIAYAAPEVRGDRVVYRVHVAALADGKARPLAETPVDADQFAPLWAPSGDALALGQDARAGARAVTIVEGTRMRTLAAPERGFDVPLSWSEGAAYLAVRSFDGSTATDPGNETAVVISPGGGRYAITATGEVIFIGWVTRG